MKPPSPLMIVFWLCMLIAPFVITAVALEALPPDTLEIPMQVGFDGHINRMAPPSDLWILSFTMFFCNGLLALCYCANDLLFAHGLVNGIKRRSTALKAYAICAICIVVVQAACTAFLLNAANPG